MGPPKFIGGNHSDIPFDLPNPKRFNGAAEIHRRKYGTNYLHLRRWRGFNGAAEIHRRKLGGGGMILRNQMASMGPPKFIGGNACLVPSCRVKS